MRANETIEHYKAEIEALELELSQSIKVIEMQKAEIERLKEQCSKSSYKDSWKNKFFKAQEEIERLTEERDGYLDDRFAVCHALRQAIAENAELQKQVDELKEERENMEAEIIRLTEERNDLEQRYLQESKERCEFEKKYKKIQHAHNIGLGAQRSHWEKKVQQAVKDKAKEIFETIFYDCWAIKDENGPRIFNEGKIKDFAKKCYGVEVE